MAPVAAQMSAQSRLSLMQALRSVTDCSPRQTSAQAVQAWAQSKQLSMQRASASSAWPCSAGWDAVICWTCMVAPPSAGQGSNARQGPRASGLPAQEVGDQAQAGGLALLGMELRAGEIVPPDDGGDRTAIVGPCQHRLGSHRLELEGVHEVGVVAIGDAGEQGVRLHV